MLTGGPEESPSDDVEFGFVNGARPVPVCLLDDLVNHRNRNRHLCLSHHPLQQRSHLGVIDSAVTILVRKRESFVCNLRDSVFIQQHRLQFPPKRHGVL